MMSSKSILGFALAAALFAVIVPVIYAAAPATGPGMGAGAGGPPARGGRGAAGGAPASLGTAMQEMSRMLTAIKKEADMPESQEQTLKDIATLARDVAIAKLQTPPVMVRMTAPEEKAKAAIDYRNDMNSLTRALLDLEDAVIAKKSDDIKKYIAKLDDLEKAGHAEFRPANN
ncbi:MAG TPA: cytochrome b562 [Phycisphaerae bacterium]|jgi:hypothetical protein